MKKSNPDATKILLAPFRKEIDKLDDQILKLLGARFDVVKRVAKVKIKHDIPAFLGDRVTQVRERAATNGLKYGIDPDFMRTLYTFIIYQACAIEDLAKAEAGKKKATETGKKKAKKK